jgi:hypothetical protein
MDEFELQTNRTSANVNNACSSCIKKRSFGYVVQRAIKYITTPEKPKVDMLEVKTTSPTRLLPLKDNMADRVSWRRMLCCFCASILLFLVYKTCIAKEKIVTEVDSQTVGIT